MPNPTTPPKLSPLLTGLVFPESPRWHDGRLWLADWGAEEVIAVDMEGKSEVVAEVASFPFSIDWLPDGRLLAVSARERQLLRQETDGSSRPTPNSAASPGGRGTRSLSMAAAISTSTTSGSTSRAGTSRPGTIALVAPDGRRGK